MEKKQRNKQTPKKAAVSKPKKNNRSQNPRKKSLTTMVDVPAARGNVSRNSDPDTQYLGNGVVRVIHREYLRDVHGSNGILNLDVSSININPGILNAFPWLSNLANNYESYLFDTLVFEYVPSCPSTEPGKVMIMIDFDAADADPTDKAQAMNYYRAESGTPWTRFSYSSLRQDLHKRKTYYTRRGTVGGNDLQTYDTGTFYYITTGQSHANILGEIFVSYSVRLITPQSGPIAVGLSRYAKLSGSNTANRFGSFSGNIIFDKTSPVLVSNVETRFIITSPWSGYVTFVIYGSAIAGGAPAITASAQSDAVLLGYATEDGIDKTVIVVAFRSNAYSQQYLQLELAGIADYEETFAYWGQASVTF